MFANLKNKLIEEVKASPSKFQQFANAAQAAVSSSSSTTPSGSDSISGNENFFSITEEDTPQNSPYRPLKMSTGAITKAKTPNTSPQSFSNGGSIPRTRKLSNSSMASDISFRLPTYDSPAVYHLQSDLEMSASEVEDSSPAFKVKLESIDKEQLYDAYKKVLDRFHRSRSRYTDLAHKYKDLERDSTKARSVLMETQEKAIRRISELREQCVLEQQAKAHLEEALRMEMDDLECKMKAYKTKLALLGENPENVAAAIIDINNSNNSTGSLIELDENTSTDKISEINNLITLVDTEISNDANALTKKNMQLVKLLEEQKVEIEKLNKKLQKSNDAFESLKMKEEENAYQLAQTKQAIYTELENKETEVKRLKTSLRKVEQQYQDAIKEVTNSSTKNSELTELQEKMRQTLLAKQEADAKLIASDHLFNETKQKLVVKEKLLLEFEEKIQTIRKEHEHRTNDLQRQNEELSQMMQRYQKNEISLAEIDNELNRTKTENDALNVIVTENQHQIQLLEKQVKTYQQQLQANEYDRELETKQINDSKLCVKELTKKISDMENMNVSKENQILQLEADIQILKKKNESGINSVSAVEAEEEKKKLTEMENKLQATTNELMQLQKDYELQENILEKQQNEMQELRQTVKDYENNLSTIRFQNERNESENLALQSQTTEILEVISKMEKQLQVVQKSHADLEQEKRNLELKIDMTKQNQNCEENINWQEQLKEAEMKLKQIEQKLQLVETENFQLAEKNCVLEENSNRMSKLFNENENYETEKIRTQHAENEISKLNEKISQILSENSELHNAKELLDHEYRSLQDEFKSIEKEKLCLDEKLKTQSKKLNLMENENQDLNKTINIEREKLLSMIAKYKSLEEQKLNCDTEISILQNKLADVERVSLLQTQNITDLSQQLRETEKKYEINLTTFEEVNKKLDIMTKTANEFEDKYLYLKENETSLRNELEISKQSLEKKTLLIEELNEKLESTVHANENLQKCEQEIIFIKEKNEILQKELDENQKSLLKSRAEIVALSQELTDLKFQNNEKIAKLASFDEKFKVLKTAYEQEKADIQKNCEQLLSEKQNMSDNKCEQVRIENEYLNTLTKQLEDDLSKQKDETSSTKIELNKLKDILQSNQCELNVLKEKDEKYSIELNAKLIEISSCNEEIQRLNTNLILERDELQQQIEQSKFLKENNDTIQKELFTCKQELNETQNRFAETNAEMLSVKKEKEESVNKLENLNQQLINSLTTIDVLKNEIIELAKVNAIQDKNLQSQAERLIEVTQNSPTRSDNATESTKSIMQESENLRKINEQLQRELEELKYKSAAEISNLTQEIDDLTTNTRHITNTITKDEQNIGNVSIPENISQVQREKDELDIKLKTIMDEVQGVSNRNLFLEQKCENFSILEQLNERLKLQNAKLSRQLDETLVSMQHNENITGNTEFEYLKNIMFQYLTGTTSASNETLVKVISAVLRFSPQQTQVALEKEHQRRSLLNKIL